MKNCGRKASHFNFFVMECYIWKIINAYLSIIIRCYWHDPDLRRHIRNLTNLMHYVKTRERITNNHSSNDSLRLLLADRQTDSDRARIIKLQTYRPTTPN